MASCYTMNFLQMALTSNISWVRHFFPFTLLLEFFLLFLTDFFSFRIYFPWSSVENKMFYYFRNSFLDIFFFFFFVDADSFRMGLWYFLAVSLFFLKKVFKVKFCSSNSSFFSFFRLLFCVCRRQIFGLGCFRL